MYINHRFYIVILNDRKHKTMTNKTELVHTFLCASEKEVAIIMS